MLVAGAQGRVETPPLPDGLEAGDISVSALAERGRKGPFIPVQVSTGLTLNTARFTVIVPEHQPSGSYEAVIRGPDRAELGILTLTVTD